MTGTSHSPLADATALPRWQPPPRPSFRSSDELLGRELAFAPSAPGERVVTVGPLADPPAPRGELMVPAGGCASMVNGAAGQAAPTAGGWNGGLYDGADVPTAHENGAPAAAAGPGAVGARGRAALALQAGVVALAFAGGHLLMSYALQALALLSCSFLVLTARACAHESTARRLAVPGSVAMIAGAAWLLVQVVHAWSSMLFAGGIVMVAVGVLAAASHATTIVLLRGPAAERRWCATLRSSMATQLGAAAAVAAAGLVILQTFGFRPDLVAAVPIALLSAATALRTIRS